MKNFIKVALIVSLALVILGSLCCAISLGIGFSYEEFWSEVEDGKYSFGPINNISEVFGRNRLNWNDDGEEWKSAAREDYTFQWSGDSEEDLVEKLDLDVYYGTVNIVENTENAEIIQVTVEYRKKNHKRNVEAYKDGTTLKIEETGSRRSWNNDSTRITVCIPKDMEKSGIMEEVSLRQGAGDIFVDMPLTAKNIDIIVNAGECDVSSKLYALEECKADVGAGEIDLQMVEAEKVTLNANVGEIDISEITADDIVIDCGIGTIDVEVTGNEMSYNYEISCNVGEVSIGDNDFNAIGANKKIDNSADKTIKIDCNVGEVGISFAR